MNSQSRSTFAVSLLCLVSIGAIFFSGCSPAAFSNNGHYTVEGNTVTIVDAEGAKQTIKIDFNSGGNVNEPTINGYKVKYTRDGVESISKDGVELPRR